MTVLTPDQEITDDGPEQDPVYQRLENVYSLARDAYDAFTGKMMYWPDDLSRGGELDRPRYVTAIHDSVAQLKVRVEADALAEEAYDAIKDSWSDTWRLVEQFSDIERLGGQGLITSLRYGEHRPYRDSVLPDEDE